MEQISTIMPKDLDKYVDSLLTELEYKKNLTLFKSVLDFIIIQEHINILKNNLQNKNILKAILEENNLEISCDITFYRDNISNRQETYCISKIEDGIIQCLDFIEFRYDYSKLEEIKLLCNKTIINSIEEL